MIRYALICEQGHDFEAWFASGAAYDQQESARALSCPCCGSHDVKKALMAPAVKRNRTEPAASRQGPERKQTYAFLKGLRAHLEANVENVGPAFPEEARKMHYGETDERSIYGEATLDEAKALEGEGIPAIPLPRLPEDHN